MQPPSPQGSSPATITAAIGLTSPVVGQAAATASGSSSYPVAVHSLTASSLPPQLPGRPGLDATSRANPLDHLVLQKI